MGEPDASVSPEVLCAACGAWFDLPGPGPDVTCPLCRETVRLGKLRRARRGVPRTGGIEPAPTETAGRPPSRSLLVRIVVVALAFGAAALAVRAARDAVAWYERRAPGDSRTPR